VSDSDSIPILRVAVPAPLRRSFDYLPPDALDPASLIPGHCLRVPFGRREVTAVLLEQRRGTDQDPDALRPARALVDDEALLPASLMALGQWAAGYYQHPIGEVFSAALPRGVREGRSLPRDAWQLTLRGKGLPAGALARAKSQARALALLQEEPRTDEELRAQGISRAVLRELRNKELIEACSAPARSPAPDLAEKPPVLAPEQARVVDAMKLDHFAIHLLEGVTGSGKTEVYLQLIARCLEAGRQVLVLIPEIGLTPQTVARFTARFTCPIVVLHSGLAEGARLAAWQAARSGQAGIVIGTRSAVFTPLARPGLLIVDEEHDASYKQQDGFRYNARDIAVKRAQIEDAPVLLGSATPSLESLHNANQGRYRHAQLVGRRGAGELPTLATIDLRGLPLQSGLSEALLAAVRDTVLGEGHQALLFLNRRGYAPTLQCHDCGWIAGCEHCDARLTVHLRRRRLRCHHCAATRALVDRCPDCASPQLLTHGLGTEQVEDCLRRALPCPVHRVDSDAMRGSEAMGELLALAERAEPCVILGTQMLTKGHHFPAVQLVGIIDADALLFSADFRGEERMAQLITQVAGRAGRTRAGGKVLIQTHQPDHPLLMRLDAGNYASVALAMLARRRDGMLPPLGQLALVRADATSEGEAERFLKDLRRTLGPIPAGVRIIGPLPSAMPRRAGRYRWQIWCLAPDRRAGHAALSEVVRAAQALKSPRGLNWFVDVDPTDVL